MGEGSSDWMSFLTPTKRGVGVRVLRLGLPMDAFFMLLRCRCGRYYSPPVPTVGVRTAVGSICMAQKAGIFTLKSRQDIRGGHHVGSTRMRMIHRRMSVCQEAR